MLSFVIELVVVLSVKLFLLLLTCRFSRSCASQVKRRSLSPGINYDNGNKRPAVICEYFAKGWCIKGSLCRFLHKREHVDSDRQEAEGDTLSTKSELRADEGISTSFRSIR